MFLCNLIFLRNAEVRFKCLTVKVRNLFCAVSRRSGHRKALYEEDAYGKIDFNGIGSMEIVLLNTVGHRWSGPIKVRSFFQNLC